MRKILIMLAFCLFLTSGYSVKVIATVSIGSVSDIAQGTINNITCTTTISGTGTAQLYNVSLQYANGTVGGWINLNATNRAVNISFNNTANPQYLRTVAVETTNFTIRGEVVSSGNNFRCMAQNTSATFIYSSISSMSVTGGAPDTTAPNINGWKWNVTNATNYSSIQQYQFNATVTDTTGISYVWIEHNFTGILTNNTATGNVGSSYYYNYGKLSAGVYYVKWYANDTGGYKNTTDFVKYYQVNKSYLPMTLYINGTDGDRSLYNNSDANFTANFSASYSFTITQWSNFSGGMSLDKTQASPLENIDNLRPRPAGNYLILANWTGNQNYTYGQANHTLTLQEYTEPPLVNAMYAGSDPLTLSTAMQHEPGSTPLFWAQVRNSSGAGISGKTITIFVYDANRNERSTANMVQFKAGLYYYASHVLSANDNGTFMLFANTTEGGVNVTAMTTFLVRAFASGSGGGLDVNQNQTLYNAMTYAQQTNTTLNKSTDQTLPFVQQINSTLNQTIYPATYNISQNVWNYTGVRNLTTYNNLIVDIWGYASRTLSDYSGVWSVVSRTLSDVSNVWSYGTRTLTSSAGLDANQNATLYGAYWYSQQTNTTLNKTIDLIPASVWGYGTRTLSAFGFASDVWSYGTKALTDVSNIWSYGTRTLSGFDFKVVTSSGNITNVTSPIYCANCSSGSGTTAQQVWEYTTRNLTQNFSNVTNFYNNYTTYNTTNSYNITNVYNLTTNTTNIVYNYTSNMVCVRMGTSMICSPRG